MNNVSAEILLIAGIFILGITLCFVAGILWGIAFIILANVVLPTIIGFFKHQAPILRH